MATVSELLNTVSDMVDAQISGLPEEKILWQTNSPEAEVIKDLKYLRDLADNIAKKYRKVLLKNKKQTSIPNRFLR